jgi:hypothetical protein
MEPMVFSIKEISAVNKSGSKNDSPNSTRIPLDSIVNLNHPSSLRDLEEDDD